MPESIRTQRVGKMLHKALGEIFVQETPQLFGEELITVTTVRLSPDLGLAKVYLSFILHQNKGAMLEKVTQQKGEIRKLLGNRIGKKLQKIPELQFYVDNSVEHATKMDQLFTELDFDEDVALLQEDELMV